MSDEVVNVLDRIVDARKGAEKGTGENREYEGNRVGRERLHMAN